jgi:transcription antitermination factor NusG
LFVRDDHIEVTSGSFAGLQGVIKEVSNNGSKSIFKISVSIFGKEMEIDAEANEIKKII